MKKFIKKMAILILTTITTSTFAADLCNQNICNIKIAELNLSENIVYILPKGVLNSSCQMNTNGIMLPSTHILFDEIYSLLLSSVLIEKEVIITLNNLDLGACRLVKIKVG